MLRVFGRYKRIQDRTLPLGVFEWGGAGGGQLGVRGYHEV